ncbi:MAG: hypothetical protein K8R86_03960 [Bacteroidales bacterium]|nr:hypothetical protein [Bacteroidales bacterium]
MRGYYQFIFTLVFLFLFGVSTKVSAQKVLDKYEGYVVTRTNDTIHGLILENSDKKYGLSVKFKAITDEDFITYYPKDLTSFYFEPGVKFETRLTGNDLCFFKVLIEGNASLFRLAKKNKAKFYTILDNSIIELKEKNSIHEEPYITQSSRYYDFVGILNVLFKDCLIDMEASGKLKEMEIKKEFIKYYNCKQTDFKQYKSRNSKIYLGLLAGYGKDMVDMYDFRTLRLFFIQKHPESAGNVYMKYIVNYRKMNRIEEVCLKDYYTMYDISFNIEYRILRKSMIQPFTGIGLGITLWQRKLTSCNTSYEKIEYDVYPKLNIDLGVYAHVTKNNIFCVQMVGFPYVFGIGIGYIQRIR